MHFIDLSAANRIARQRAEKVVPSEALDLENSRSYMIQVNLYPRPGMGPNEPDPKTYRLIPAPALGLAEETDAYASMPAPELGKIGTREQPVHIVTTNDYLRARVDGMSFANGFDKGSGNASQLRRRKTKSAPTFPVVPSQVPDAYLSELENGDECKCVYSSPHRAYQGESNIREAAMAPRILRMVRQQILAHEPTAYSSTKPASPLRVTSSNGGKPCACSILGPAVASRYGQFLEASEAGERTILELGMGAAGEIVRSIILRFAADLVADMHAFRLESDRREWWDKTDGRPIAESIHYGLMGMPERNPRAELKGSFGSGAATHLNPHIVARHRELAKMTRS